MEGGRLSSKGVGRLHKRHLNLSYT